MRLVRRVGVIRTCEITRLGISRSTLTRLLEEGCIERVSRGLYSLPNADLSEHHSLVEVSKRVPAGVICLLSALQFHGLTTQAPFEVWLAIGSKSWKPTFDYPRVRVVRFSEAALDFGVEERQVGGVTLRVTSAAKTVADCFKYRNKIGLDVAIEALRDYRKQRHPLDTLWEAAEFSRVKNVIRPYLEAAA